MFAQTGDDEASGSHIPASDSEDDSASEELTRQQKRNRSGRKRWRANKADRKDEVEVRLLLSEDGLFEDEIGDGVGEKLSEEASIGPEVESATEDRPETAEEMEIRWEKCLTVFYPDAPVKAVIVSRDEDLLQDWFALECSRRATVDPLAPDFAPLAGRFRYISEPGIYFGIEYEQDRIVFVIRILPWQNMEEMERQFAIRNLDIILRVHQAHRPIMNNASTRHPHGIRKVGLDGREFEHGRGILTSIGYRPATLREKGEGKKIARAAPLPGIDRLQYENDCELLPHVVHWLSVRMGTLYGSALQRMSTVAMRLNLPSFGVLELPAIGELQELLPFANLLAVSSRGFSNYAHEDDDNKEAKWSYGTWAAAGLLNGVWKFGENIDHSHIRGGGFYWPGWAIALRLDQAAGLADGLWLGTEDSHCTGQSEILPDCLRLGCSLQITNKFTNAWQSYERHEVQSAVTTHADRMRNLERFEQRGA